MDFIKRNILKSRMNAFTLAEVLITLGIIGVVAAITIPTLMNNMQENNYKVAYKKAFSIASQAWQSAYADNMMENRTGWDGEVANYDNFNQFMAKFDVVKTCKGSDNSVIAGCWAPNETVDTWWGLPFAGVNEEVCFIDKSGTAWCNAHFWGYILVDINGAQKPNIYGKDRWAVWTSVNGSNDSSTPGVPNCIKPFADSTTAADYYECPAVATHHCNYTSWLFN